MARTGIADEGRGGTSRAVVGCGCAVPEGMRAHSDGAADSLIFPGVGGRLNGGSLILALRRATGTDPSFGNGLAWTRNTVQGRTRTTGWTSALMSLMAGTRRMGVAGPCRDSIILFSTAVDDSGVGAYKISLSGHPCCGGDFYIRRLQVWELRRPLSSFH